MACSLALLLALQMLTGCAEGTVPFSQSNPENATEPVGLRLDDTRSALQQQILSIRKVEEQMDALHTSYDRSAQGISNAVLAGLIMKNSLQRMSGPLDRYAQFLANSHP
jgi:hypothetical protein